MPLRPKRIGSNERVRTRNRETKVRVEKTDGTAEEGLRKNATPTARRSSHKNIPNGTSEETARRKNPIDERRNRMSWLKICQGFCRICSDQIRWTPPHMKEGRRGRSCVVWVWSHVQKSYLLQWLDCRSWREGAVRSARVRVRRQ